MAIQTEEQRNLLAQAQALGIPSSDIATGAGPEGGYAGQSYFDEIQRRIQQTQNPQPEAGNWYPNTQNTNTEQLTTQQLNSGVEPFAGYMDPAGIAQRNDLSGQMAEARASGDTGKFQQLLKEFQGSSFEGSYPAWMMGTQAPGQSGMEPWQQRMIDSGAGLGGYAQPPAAPNAPSAQAGTTPVAAGRGGTVIIGGEDSANPFLPMESVNELSGSPDVLLRQWKWMGDALQFQGSTGAVELRIEYTSSGAAPQSGSVGWDNSQNFLEYRTASLIAPAYNMPELAQQYRMEALGPSGQADGTGGALRGFMLPMLREKTKRRSRPQPFRR